ncbi:DUF1217 domain-containing protein [Ferrovibrio xuzhouensis]|uniref:DUF1217 domain-containing protein n=1 Tax=Ferrovibrio xuzhouensis TaxID=1576914 RepID=A0ABV7V9T1_9PROT
MAIDLSALLGGNVSSATVSPLAMFKKLQKLAEENKAEHASDSAAEQAKSVVREFNNAATRLRNSQYKQSNAQVQNDVIYFKNRVNSATTVSELINDDRFLRVLANANGFGDLFSTDKQKLKDILTSDLSDPASAAYQGSLKELEFAKKYNFGASGTQLDANGNIVGIDASGKLVNDGSQATDLPAGLAKLKGLAVDLNGTALVVSGAAKPSDNGKLIAGPDVASNDAAAYSKALTKPLLQEQAAPDPSAAPSYYEYDGTEYQTYVKRKDLQKDVDYYRENIGSVKSLDDLFGNQRLLTFVLKSYGLESEAQYPGKIRKIIESDLSDVNSLANRFQDPRYQQLTKDLSVNILGTGKLTLQSTTDDIVKKYQQTSYEQYLDDQAPGVRAAIEFERRIKDVTQTVQLLGDSVLREVVTVANNIPKELAYQETDAQIAALEKRVDLKNLKSDQGEIDKLVLRYLTFKDADGTGSSQSYLLNLFG